MLWIMYIVIGAGAASSVYDDTLKAGEKNALGLSLIALLIWPATIGMVLAKMAEKE